MRYLFPWMLLAAGSEIPLEEISGSTRARVFLDPVTGIYEFTGRGHKVRILPGLGVGEIDGEIKTLGGIPVIRSGRLWFPEPAAEVIRAVLGPGRLPVAKSVKRTRRFRVALDPGHGGAWTGARGATGALLEKHVTLDLCQRVAALLESDGAEVILTRLGDSHFSRTLYEDLQHRLDVAATANADVFVSVHLNWSDNRDARGFEVYVHRGEGRHRQESLALARSIQEKMARELDIPDRGVREANYYVLRNAPFPAVLVEVDFLSNRAAEREWMSESHRQRVAGVLADGIREHVLRRMR